MYLDTSALGALYIPEALSSAAAAALGTAVPAICAQTFTDAAVLLRSGAVALSALDALHLAVVTSSREALCTADRQLARAAARLGVKVHLVRA